jgi:osmotically-inducible protein OsmY
MSTIVATIAGLYTLPNSRLRSSSVRRSRPVLAALALSVSCLALNGCVVAVVGAGAAAGGYTMAQERGPEGTIDDAAIKTRINARWLDSDAAIAKYVDLNVFEGRVLLTGDVPNPTLRDEAVAQAWKTDGVKEVINEIHLGDSSTIGTTAQDNWIQTRLRTELTFDGNVKSLNYTIETVDGVVYVLGVAGSQDELNRVLSHARTMRGVQRVVSYVRIRSGVGEQQAPAEISIDAHARPAAAPPSPPGAPPPTYSPPDSQPYAQPPADQPPSVAPPGPPPGHVTVTPLS